MLDRMRQHKRWLKWSLALVCLAFVFFYIPAFVNDPGAGVVPSGVLAEIEGREITVAEFRRVYRQRLQELRTSAGGEVSEEVLRQLGIDRDILQQMINHKTQLVEASRLGLTVTDAEVRERIVSLPGLQENGQFIGEDRYRQLLWPLTPAEFEEGQRESLLLERLRTALTDWITISDAELEEEYRRRNEKVKLSVVTFEPDDYRDEVDASDEEIAAHYAQNTDDYRVPEKRKIRFLVIDVEAIRATITIAPEEVESYYNTNIGLYTSPGRVRASHILLRTEGEDEAGVRPRAEEILAQAKAGADFAELAMRYSEDETTAEGGGDLDSFGRGQMVPEFEEAAFALAPGTISDLVRTAFGFHIIKVVEKTEETVQTLDEVRKQITNQLQLDRAQARGTALAQTIATEVEQPADLETAAAARDLSVQESEFAASDEPILGLGIVPELSGRAFQLEQGEVAGPIRVPQGYAFITITAVQDVYDPPFEDVRNQVQEDVIQRNAEMAAQEQAAAAAVTLKDAADFASAAETADLTVETTELITRGSAIPGLGISPEVDAVAFSLPTGQTSDPVQVGSTAAVIHVIERQDVTDEESAAAQESLRSEILVERQNRFFSAYMSKAMQQMSIEVDVGTLLQVTG